MTVEYNPESGILWTSLRYKSTVVQAVLDNTEFWLLLVFHVAVMVSYKRGWYTPSDYSLDLNMNLTSVTGGLMTFFVVFYNGNVFERYTKLYGLTKTMNEFNLYAVSIISRELKDKTMVRKLTRQLLASSFLFFFERTPHEHEELHDGSNISPDEWEQLQALDLLTEYEMDILQDHCKRLKHHSCPSFLLVQWSMKLYRTQSPRLPELEKTYWNIRRCQDDVVEIMELPMPFQYWHVMNLMMMLNLTLWGYALALEDTYFATIIFAFINVVFQGVRELSVALADPFGDDEADFPVNDWMTTLYQRLYSIVEDPWDIREETPLPDNGPLDMIKDGEAVINLMVDARKQQRGKVRKRKPPRKSQEEEEEEEEADKEEEK